VVSPKYLRSPKSSFFYGKGWMEVDPSKNIYLGNEYGTLAGIF
jgi:hypothetical protein